MEGIVAKRSLKKSYYKNKKSNINIVGMPRTEFETREKDKKSYATKFEEYKSKVLYKISLQSITIMSFLIFALAIKYFNITVVKEADITKKIITAYKTSYSLNEIKEETKKVAKKTYLVIKPVIPKAIQSKAKELYINMISKNSNNSISKNNKVNEVIVYEESSSNNKENKKVDQQGLGASVENEGKIVTASSAVSSEMNIVEKIKNTKVSFVKPLTGTITSHFGAREVIFEGVDSYHTGTDIAASTGTPVVSSIKGEVTEATYNKYNGNFVEVKNGKIVTKYLHMSKISVKKGAKVKAGDKIGEVGSTGLATGPHLHLEIIYDNVKVDPELVLKL